MTVLLITHYPEEAMLADRAIVLNKGNIVLFSTHVLEVAEKLCDKVAIISKGKLVFDGTIKEMQDKVGEDESLEKMFLELVDDE